MDGGTLSLAIQHQWDLLEETLPLFKDATSTLEELKNESKETSKSNIGDAMKEHGQKICKLDPLLGDFLNSIGEVQNNIQTSYYQVHDESLSKHWRPLSTTVAHDIDRLEKNLTGFKKAQSASDSAKQKVHATRHARGTVNMTKLLEAEKIRDEAESKVQSLGTIVLTDAKKANQFARIETLKAMLCDLRAYQEFFNNGLEMVDKLIPKLEQYTEQLQSSKERRTTSTVGTENNTSSIGGRRRSVAIGRRASSIPVIKEEVEKIPLEKTTEDTTEDSASPKSVPKSSSWIKGNTAPTISKPTSGTRYLFEVDAKVGGTSGWQKGAVVEVDPDERTLHMQFPTKRMDKICRKGSQILCASNSSVNDLKIKLYWKGKKGRPQPEPDRLVFRSHELKQRFVEAAWHIQNADDETKIKAKGEEFSIFVGTWNVGNAVPPSSLAKWIPLDKYDLIAIGAQECEYSTRPPYPNNESDWFATVLSVLGENYVKIAGVSLLAMRIVVLARREHYYKITHIKTGHLGTGLVGKYGNKGAVGTALRIHDTTVIFVSCHLAARLERVAARNEDFEQISHLLPRSLANRGGGSRYYRGQDLQCAADVVLWFGDLNYRIGLGRDEVIKLAEEGNFSKLHAHDQLKEEQAGGRCFVGFKEGKLNFKPTYRYNRGDRTYSEEKMRVPSYCDRVLWKTANEDIIKLEEYSCCDEVVTSDHSPVYAALTLNTMYPAKLPTDIFTPPCVIMFTELKASYNCGQEKEKKKVPSPYVMIYGEFMEEPTVTSTLQHTSDAHWLSHLIPLVETFCYDKEWVETRHLWLTVRDTGKDTILGQTCVSLSSPEFTLPLTMRGVLVGVISGSFTVLQDSDASVLYGNKPLSRSVPGASQSTRYSYRGGRGSGGDARSPRISLSAGTTPPTGQDSTTTSGENDDNNGNVGSSSWVGTSTSSSSSSSPSSSSISTSGMYASTLDRSVEDYYSDAAVIKQGFLTKMGGIRKNWKTRWFKLTEDGCLSYYQRQSDQKPISAVQIMGVEEAQFSGKKHCFSVATAGRTYHFSADGDVERAEWMGVCSSLVETNRRALLGARSHTDDPEE